MLIIFVVLFCSTIFGNPFDDISWHKYNADEIMYNLGCVYEHGKGVAIDYERAKNCYERAADLGNADAMFNLGALYESGKGVAIDYVMAKDYYERAAKLGNADAMFNLGALYEFGKGVAIYYAMAKDYYERAAKLEHHLAKARLAELLLMELNDDLNK